MNKTAQKTSKRRTKSASAKGSPAESMSWSAVMATLSASILAIASIFTAFIAYSTWRHVQETSRPYFSIKGLPELETPNDQTLSMHFINAGDHPAEALRSQITMILAETGQKIYEQGNHILSTIPRETDATVLLDLSEWPEGGATPFDQEIYLTLWLSYYDPLLQKSFEQNFFLRCNGLVEDKFVELTYMTQEELDELLDTIERNLTTQPWNPLIQ
ncbi:MAG: hypothetical protein FWF88_01640 [Peptococcaceae bacterium]|nr:hypothetical protein [Peptococcaceae bacterium]MDR2736786.1 hypothetical protein [Gracilibacteraceae bacterium]